MTHRYSRRTGWDAAPNRLARALERRRRQGRPILDLTESNPTRCGLSYPEEAIRRALTPVDGLSYEPDPRGLPIAREAIAADYASRGAAVGAERIVLTAGTSQAYSFLFRLLADPGERVLAPAPSYPLFEILARLDDLRLDTYPLCADLDFAIDLDTLRRRVTDRTRAILVVNPGNPGGAYLKGHEVEGLLEIGRERGVPLICDEVFGDYPLGPSPGGVSTLAGHADASLFVLNGLSKMLALPQLKLAWILALGEETVARRTLERLDVISDTFLSVGTQVQHALPDLLRLRSSIQAVVRERIVRNRETLERMTLRHHACRCLPVEGGWSSILRIPRTLSEEEWALLFLEEEGVLVHPGYFFDLPGEGRVVLSLLVAPASFSDGLDRILRRVAAARDLRVR